MGGPWLWGVTLWGTLGCGFLNMSWCPNSPGNAVCACPQPDGVTNFPSFTSPKYPGQGCGDCTSKDTSPVPPASSSSSSIGWVQTQQVTPRKAGPGGKGRVNSLTLTGPKATWGALWEQQARPRGRDVASDGRFLAHPGAGSLPAPGCIRTHGDSVRKV